MQLAYLAEIIQFCCQGEIHDKHQPDKNVQILNTTHFFQMNDKGLGKGAEMEPSLAQHLRGARMGRQAMQGYATVSLSLCPKWHPIPFLVHHF